MGPKLNSTSASFSSEIAWSKSMKNSNFETHAATMLARHHAFRFPDGESSFADIKFDPMGCLGFFIHSGLKAKDAFIKCASPIHIGDRIHRKCDFRYFHKIEEKRLLNPILFNQRNEKIGIHDSRRKPAREWCENK